MIKQDTDTKQWYVYKPTWFYELTSFGKPMFSSRVDAEMAERLADMADIKAREDMSEKIQSLLRDLT